ncbi:hypothetical protein LVJ82_16535 [Vitreoscilla massiliensis]|uniref:Uncharacterized protein n=1 Tax=Vitreoscilla massiliensis TaxID=1689272 RepID=A0ABY4E105_9NEIS|nr:hypothetical protein [Vitreoscilla massiliensis]UOO89031.1 hypothetical protein LVJ82_16535 [Vitreoscilla massiliensis]
MDTTAVSRFFIPPTWLLLLVSAALAWVCVTYGAWYCGRLALTALCVQILYYGHSRVMEHSSFALIATLLILLQLHFHILNRQQIEYALLMAILLIIPLGMLESWRDKRWERSVLANVQVNGTYTIINHQALWQMLVYNVVLTGLFTYHLIGLLQLQQSWPAVPARLLGQHAILALLTLSVWWARVEKIKQTQFVAEHGGEWLRIDGSGITWQDDGNDFASINPTGLEWRSLRKQRLFFEDHVPNRYHIAWNDVVDITLRRLGKNHYELVVHSQHSYCPMGHTGYLIKQFGQFRNERILHKFLLHYWHLQRPHLDVPPNTA